MPHWPWRPPCSHSPHGAPLPTPPHTTINQHSGWLLSVLASGKGAPWQPLLATYVTTCQRTLWVSCGLVVGCDLRRNTLGFVPGDRRYPSDKMMSILVGTGAISVAASTKIVHRAALAGTSLGNNAWWRQQRNSRNRSRRQVFLHDGTLCINWSWRSPLFYRCHGASLLALKHTTISKHTMQQVYVVKTRFLLIINVYTTILVTTHQWIDVPDGHQLQWLYNQCRALAATTMAHKHQICLPSWPMSLDCHVGNVQACCDQVERCANKASNIHDYKVCLNDGGACKWQLGARISSTDLVGMCLIVILFHEKFYWNVWDHAQITALNSLTPMVAYMRPSFWRASFELSNFSNFCPLTTFDSSKCARALLFHVCSLTFLCSLWHRWRE